MSFTNGANGANGHINGHSDVAGPSTSAIPALGHDAALLQEPSTAPPFQESFRFQHDTSIVDHIYRQGFQQGNYADINLIVLNRSYRLHRLILSRSPYLEHLMFTSHNGNIFVPLEQYPHITEEAFAIVIGYLYASTSINLIKPENARSVLGAGCLLGGMDELCAHAYEICKTSISAESIYEWLEFLAAIPFSSSSSTPGTPLPASPSPSHIGLNGLPSGQEGPAQDPSILILGSYGPRLREDVFSFLVVTLPSYLIIPGGEPSEELISVYTRLPFDYFKAAVESPNLPIPSTQERFRFAKAAIAARKSAGMARDAEETVVLAFGTAEASAVHVTRKLRRRPLWKVGGGK